MAKKDFLPRQEAILDEWEANYLAKLVTIGPLLGIDPLVLADLNTVVAAHRVAFATSIAKQAEARAATELKLSTLADAIAKIRDVAQKCRASSAYTNAYGAELGLIGSEQTLNLSEVKPELIDISYQNDQIIFDWKKGHMDGIIVYGANRTLLAEQIAGQQSGSSGSGGQNPSANYFPQGLVWEEIGRDYRSPYVDRRRNLTLEPETRYYKLRYLYKDQIVGVDSEIIKVIAELYTV